MIHSTLCVYRLRMTHDPLCPPIRVFQALSSANPWSLPQQIKGGCRGWLERRHVHWPHFVLLVSSGARRRSCFMRRASRRKWGGGLGWEKEGEFTRTRRPSSHCSINADILRITAAVIKGCQDGNYLLLSGLPADIPLKPIPAYFICRLLRIPFCGSLIKMPLSNGTPPMTDK